MAGLLNRFDVMSDDKDLLFLALSLPFGWKEKGATHWTQEEKDGKQQITLYSYETNGAVPLPFKLNNPTKMTSFVQGWLDDADHGKQGSGDGSYNKGWRCYIDDHFSFCSVQAVWNYYSK